MYSTSVFDWGCLLKALAFESSKCDPGDLLMSDDSVLSFRFVISS
jgi:hypothetical protein